MKNKLLVGAVILLAVLMAWHFLPLEFSPGSEPGTAPTRTVERIYLVLPIRWRFYRLLLRPCRNPANLMRTASPCTLSMHWRPCRNSR